MRADDGEHVGEAGDLDAEQRLRAVRPFLPKALPAAAPDVDAVEAAGHGVEAGCIDQDVELVLLAPRHHAVRGNALDGRLVQIDKAHIVPVEGLVIARLHRDAAGAEAVVLRHQLLRGLRVADALADSCGP